MSAPLEMNPEIRACWTAALRSGEYARGSGYLRQMPRTGEARARFCCLGVLCDLAEREGVVRSERRAGFYWRYAEEGHYLPDAVVTWAGLERPNPVIPERGSLGGLNDDGWSFAAIADAIDGSAPTVAS